MMTYAAWMVGLAIPLVILERIIPRHPLPVIRPKFFEDVLYVVINGHLVAVGLAYLVKGGLDAWPAARDTLAGWNLVGGWPLLTQFLVLLVAHDLTQWLTHNLLHRVPWLWEFHKVHHSVEVLDWIANWHFHWFEIVVYKTLSLLPFLLVGFSFDAIAWFGVVSTVMGHFNHANIRVKIGPLKYLLNSPEMHVWHHVHPKSGPAINNLGIIFSCWDWIFGTAHMPGHDPDRLGCDGMENVPDHIPGQLVYPLKKKS